MLPRPGGSAGLIGSFHYPVPSKNYAGGFAPRKHPRVNGSGILLFERALVNLHSALVIAKEINMFWAVTKWHSSHAFVMQVLA
jgi:hypothetical protein